MTKTALNIDKLIEIALKAGEISLKYFNQDDLNVAKKADFSLVTQADLEISKFLEASLKSLHPNIPIICEEGQNRQITDDGTFWLNDPIDGTHSFVKGENSFTVNIALIEEFQPVFGIIFAPAFAGGVVYIGDVAKNRAFKGDILNPRREILKMNPTKSENHLILTSQDIDLEKIHQAYEKLMPGKNFKEIKKLSSSLKFCQIADNQVDLYLHLKNSSEWDVAAGHAIVKAAGGEMVNLDGSQFIYNKPNFLNNEFVVYRP